jgi:hypothetical protein
LSERPAPWIPEFFSAPALARLEDKRRGEKLIAVSYFAGLMAGEVDALLGSFGGEPEPHDPVRGRIKDARAFAASPAARLFSHGPSIPTVGMNGHQQSDLERSALAQRGRRLQASPSPRLETRLPRRSCLLLRQR